MKRSSSDVGFDIALKLGQACEGGNEKWIGWREILGPAIVSRDGNYQDDHMIRIVSVFLLFFVTGIVKGVTEPPNVIIVYTDDQGSVDANCYGSKDLMTPNIDRLAETGVRFTEMRAPSAICSASRAGLMTGQMPPRAGVPGNVSSAKGSAGMPTEKFTMAELLKSAGYETGHIGKWHLGYTPETMPNGQGFDYSYGHMGGCIDNYSHFFYWNGPNRHDLWRNGEEIWEDGKFFGTGMMDELIGFIDRNEKGPFFVYWAINWPHYPLQGTAKWRDYYADKGLESPRDSYAAFMSSTDDLLGQLLDHLEANGLRENTLVIFQSDHGHSVEERTFYGGGSAGHRRGHKGTLWEGGLRVPSIASWPAGLPQGEVRDQLACGIDWYPTIAQLAGAKIPETHAVDGISLVEVLKSADAEVERTELYWRMGGKSSKAKWAAREGKWKMLGNPNETVRPDGVMELTGKDKELFLVDLENDPGETTNVRDKNPEIVERLLKIRASYEAEFTR